MDLNAGHSPKWMHAGLMLLISGAWQHCLESNGTNFFRNEDVRRTTKQPNLTVIIQSWRLSIFGHIAHRDDDADAKRILTAPPPQNWKRPPGRIHITWLNTVQRDLRAYNLTLNETVDLAQNRPLWRLMSMYGAMHSWWCMPEKKTKAFSNTVLFHCDIVIVLFCWWHWWAATASAARVTRLGSVTDWWHSWPTANTLACLCLCQWWTFWTYLVTVSLFFSVLDELCFTLCLMQGVIF